MFDASTVGLLCALAAIVGYCIGVYQSMGAGEAAGRAGPRQPDVE